MDHIYGNVDYQLSQTPGKEKVQRSDVSDCADLSVRESNPVSSRRTVKVLVAALGLLLVCALVALCVLGFLYSNKGVSFEALSEQYASAIERLSVQKQNYTELKSHFNEVQLKYENASKQLDSFKETGRKYEELRAKYQKAHEVFSSCSDCQKCALCREGWKPFGVKCYYFSTDKLNWTESRDRCAEKGGHLVVITSEAEQRFVSSGMKENHWIGLNDLETEGKWMWVNNQALTETGVKFWHKRENEPDEPDNWKNEDPTGENCAALGNESGNTDTWYDASCSKLKKYICEK